MNSAKLLDQPIYSPPSPLIFLQCSLFAILFGIWVLPETILVRHLCLFIGGLISLHTIFRNWPFFAVKRALPIWGIIALMIWVSFHLVFLSNDVDAQWLEYGTIWKRSAIGFIFASGLGLALSGQTQSEPQKARISVRILFAGFALPTLIFWLKICVGFMAQRYGLEAPAFLMLQVESTKFFVHKSAYVFFCLPLYAISLGCLYQLYLQSKLMSYQSLIYIACIFAVLLNFIVEKDRNGEIYAFFLTLCFCALLLKDQIKTLSYQKILLGCLITAVPVIGALYQFRNNPQWNSIISDAKIAVQIDQYNNWQDQATLKPPKDAQGRQISGTNYERIAWGTAALRLISQNPLGFGLVERSFGGLGAKVWPEAKLHQSHSGWLDFTLGLGLPGLFLLLGAGVLAWHQALSSSGWAKIIGGWGLASILLMMFTTELSQKVYIDAMIFMIGLVGSLNLKERGDSFNH
jgi:O-Antigen ligase